MNVHVVFPAAGVGKRFGLSIPKQYAQIQNKTVMEWTLSAFEGISSIQSHVIAVQTSDLLAIDVLSHFPHVTTVEGGNERSDSVLNAVNYLENKNSRDDWVLVHDIARPCVRESDIEKLISFCLSENIGAILGRPVTDTIKRKLDVYQHSTVERETLWSVQTPQCFRLGELLDALVYCKKEQIPVTDEASAIEAIKQPYAIIEGSSDNIKLTNSEDQFLIEHYLALQGRSLT
jgi:2-C-methyl-D-erythritol 4-phosphate cytidylyltransferase